MSKEISVRPSDLLDPYHEEDAITRFAIDLVALVSDIDGKPQIETPDINPEEDSLRKRDLEFKKKYNISLEEAKKIVFGDTNGSYRQQ